MFDPKNINNLPPGLLAGIKPPETDEELWNFVKNTFGVEIPRVRVCPHHSTPFEAFAEAYFAREPMSIWRGARGSGKCKAYSDTMLLPSGHIRTFAEMLTMGETEVYSPGVAHTFRNRAIFADNGIRDCKKITLESGEAITCTLEHPVYSAEYVTSEHRTVKVDNPMLRNSEDLVPGMVVLTAQAIPSHTEYDMEDEGLILLGFLLGDGCTSSLGPSAQKFSNGNEKIVEVFTKCIEHYGGKVKNTRPYEYKILCPRIKGRTDKGSSLWRLLEQFEIMGYGSHEKKFPSWVWKCSDRQLALILNGLWATDGYISYKKRKKGHKAGYNLRLRLTSEQLIKDNALAMHRLGIPGFRRSKGPGSYKDKDGNKIICRDRFYWEPFKHLAEDFFTKVGYVFGKEDTCRELEGYLQNRKVGHAWRTAHVMPGAYFWQSIVSVEDITTPTVSIEVPNGNLFCSPVVEHNTMLLALLSLTEMVTYGASIRLLGGSGEQSQRVLSYLTGKDPNAAGMFLEHPNAPRWLMSSEPTKHEMRTLNGGWIRALMASQKSIRGPHPSRLRLDECKSYATLVSCVNGDKRICDLDPLTDLVYAWDGRSFVPARISKVKCMGYKPTIKLHLSNGRIDTCTEDHPILTKNRGWVDAKECKNEDILLGMPDIHEVCETKKSVIYGHVSNMLEGKSRRGGFPLPGLQKETGHEDLCIPADGGTQGPYKMREVLQKAHGGSRQPLRGLRLQGTSGIDRVQRLLPQAQSLKESPMRRLWKALKKSSICSMPPMLQQNPKQRPLSKREGQGFCKTPTKEQTSSTSIFPRINRSETAGCFRYKMESSSSCRAFHSRHRLNRISVDYRSRERLPQSSTLQNYQGTLLQKERLRPSSTPFSGRQTSLLANGDPEEVRVLKITEGPVTEVWDITVPKYHNFVAEGIVVKNCDVMDIEILDAALLQVKQVRGIQTQIVASSTHNHQNGTMSTLIKRGLKLHTWCCPPDQEILDALNCPVPIKSIIDRPSAVMSGSGFVRPVTNTFERDFSGNLIEIKVQGIYHPFKVTPEHQIPTVNRGWNNAKDLVKGDILLDPGLPLKPGGDYLTGWVIGDWLAGGYKHSFSYRNTNWIKPIEEAVEEWVTKSVSETYLKKLPTEINFAKGLIKGLELSGTIHRDGQNVVPIPYKNLAWQLFRIATSLGLSTSIYPYTDKKTGSPHWRIEFRNFSKRTRNTKLKNGIGRRITKIQEIPYEGKVYDLTVDVDHTFLASGISVSNCYKETLKPHGFTDPSSIERLKSMGISQEQWRVEMECGEPRSDASGIDPMAVDWCFNPRVTGMSHSQLMGNVSLKPWIKIGEPEPGVFYAHGCDWAKAKDHCVDEETEIFTARGWLRHDEVKEGDLTLAINEETGLSEWTKIDSVFRAYREREMIHMHGTTHDSLTTEDHRWLVKEASTKKFRWKTTETLNTKDLVIRSNKVKLPTTETYPNDLVGILAWSGTPAPLEVLTKLTQKQLDYFIGIALPNDELEWLTPLSGKVRRAPNTFTASEGMTDAFVSACALAGVTTRSIFNEKTKFYTTTIIKNDLVNPIKSTKVVIESKPYAGIIWCPSLKHRNWLARRNGVTYYTGNTVITTIRVNPEPPHEVVAWQRINRMPWPVMVDLFNERVKLFGGSAWHDVTGVGHVCQDFLTVPSYGFDFRNTKARTQMIGEYVDAIENHNLIYPRIDWVYQEHKGVTYEELYGSKHLPDSISAGSMAWAAIKSSRVPLIGRAW